MSGLAYESMFNNRPNDFGIDIMDYIKPSTNYRLSDNINKYVNATGRYTDINGVVSGRTPSLAAIDAVDVSKAPAVFSEKGVSDWVTNEALNSSNNSLGNTKVDTGVNLGNTPMFSDGSGNWYSSAAEASKMKADFDMGDTSTGGGFMEFLGSDAAKNAIGIGGLALSGFGALNNYKAAKQAKKQWEAENARANEIMAMNREKYQTYKADKARLNAGYSGSGLAASGGN